MPGRKILLGRIAGAHGIKGDVLIKTYTNEPADIGTYGPLSDEAGIHSYAIKIRRSTPSGVVAAVDGIVDRTSAENLKGTQLYVDRDAFPATSPDEYYYADLTGLAVLSPDGMRIGTVAAVQNYGAGDLIEIALAGSRRTELVPFDEAHVPEICISAGRLVVRLPPQAGEEPDDKGGA